MRRLRSRSEWRRLAGTVVAVAAVAVLACWPAGWVLAHASDAIWGPR